MNRTTIILAVVALCLACPLQAEYTFSLRGEWPETWPEELEPLREQAVTYEGPLLPALHHAIPFTQRDQFEAARPHLLAIKTPGAPIILKRDPGFWLRDSSHAGVCIHTPPEGTELPADAASVDDRLTHVIYIELFVDGDIVDLNRIPLPPNTPIVDERFSESTDE